MLTVSCHGRGRQAHVIGAELDAAGVSQPRLREAYRCCRTLNARHGRTFFLATRLLTPAQRPAVHALYGFARLADDILDDLDSPLDTGAKTTRLQTFSKQFFNGGNGGDEQTDLVLTAVRHTAALYGIDAGLFGDFLESMRMDLTVTDYPDRAALNHYMHGSAEVIGLELLPVLGTVAPAEEAAPYAAALGKAFQLTNFLRDVDEDLVRHRVYLPADELAAFDVDRDLLIWCHEHRQTDPRVRSALAAQHHITRGIYRFAGEGVQMLAPWSRPCVATALTLYSEILDRIEASDFAVFRRRARVGTARRVSVAGGALIQAWRARRGRAA
jgi:phytoene synthase